MLESIKSIKSELSTIKDGQAEQQAERVEQQAERAQVMEGLKAVEAVARKLEKIEEVQDKHEQKLTKQDEAIKKTSQKCEQGEERINMLEEKMKKFDQNGFDLRRCNTVAKEVREMEKRERNLVIFNIPDSKEEVEEDREKADLREVESVFKELGLENIQPKNIGRIGKIGGRYPQQIRVILRTVDECESILKKCRDGTMLKNNVFITRDRTFNQRQEAKLFRLGEDNGEIGQPEGGKGGGGGRGRGRPRGSGGRGSGGRGGGGRGGGGRGGGRGRGGGGRGGRVNDQEKRKRGGSDDEEESKRQRRAENSGEGVGHTGQSGTPDQNRTRPTPEHPPTPRQIPIPELGAVGGTDESF